MENTSVFKLNGYEISVCLRMLTPALAKELLEKSAKNRKVSQTRVNHYAKLITDGLWELTDQAVSLTKLGKMINGQHRSLAVLLANKPIPVWIHSGYDEAIYPKLDGGKNRTPADALSIHGAPDPVHQASIIKSYLFLLTPSNSPLKTNPSGTVRVISHGIVRNYGSNTEVVDEYAKHSELYDKLLKLTKSATHKYKLFPPGYVGGFAAFLVKERGYEYERVEKYIYQLFSIEPDQNPITSILRDKMIKDAFANKRMKGWLRHALMIKCWNNWVTDKKVSGLNYNENDKFPEII